MKEGILIYTKNGIHEVVFYEEIIYITVQKHYILLKLTDGRSLPAKYSLKQIEKQLPPNIFFRTHRNYIVSLRYIKSVGVDTIIVTGGEEILLTQEIRKSFFNRFTVIGSVENEGSHDGISPPRDRISPPRALSPKPRQNPS
ncbi:LytTR family transcriptional regulator [Chitinophaga filiformis]|uniref:LytR/AlgR family response regulator transcription factor n=1 Tax=Chitinophaga filiformis TaxID=104663 RepID=UPI001F179602|nr:LytTR family DNA-binding domain-containing protein [Chitinophaga filiformis]MCF6402633.1 LytTR family transcriptional regulator [Chitinophaga filiformis]MCF6403449.1 LytTR family transcriptional regulator [Chitinophaga filiformis]